MSTFRAHLSLLAANVIYGANYTIAKEVMPAYIKPFGFIILRVYVSLLLFWMVHPFFSKEKVDKKDFPKLALCGLTGATINQLMFFKGLSLTSPIHAALIMITSPILVLVIAHILLKEKVTALKISGIVLGTAGAVVLIVFGNFLTPGKGATVLGDICIFINALAWGSFLVIVKPLMQKYHPVTVIKWTFLFGALFALPFGFNELMEVKWETFTGAVWMGVFYVVVMVTFIAYFLNTVPLRTVSPSVASAYIYLQPLLATAFALALGKDELTVVQVVSAMLIFTGVYLVSRTSEKLL
jgi:drug/metabolite transporter (DMT)-like permease